MSNLEQIQLFGDKQIRTAWDDAEGSELSGKITVHK